MSKEMHKALLEDLEVRQDWEGRQAVFYDMRHDGLPRKFKPWPHAADLHFPLIDSMIGKHKPFYSQILFGSELLATFVALKAEMAPQAISVAQWFDWQVKQRSNLENECLIFVDDMLMSGRGICKVFWDQDAARLRFEAVDPIYLIVPGATRELQEADHICHVQRYTVAAYKREKRFNQDEALLKRITGTGSEDEPTKEDAKETREGINFGTKNEIIVWESYKRGSSGWDVEWFSPLVPEVDVRKPISLVYKHKESPFVDFPFEVKDAGWYSPRGIPELVKHDEAYLTKILNEKADALTLWNRPIYTSAGQIPNVANLKLLPGSIVPQQISRVDPGPAPVGFDSEITLHRSLAEYRVGMPDFGIGRQDQGDKSRTATEVSAIGNMMGLQVGLAGRIFKASLNRLFAQSWSLLVQFDSKRLQYWMGSESLSLDPGALQGEYAIIPNGSADNVNKQLMLQKSVTRMQTLQGNPFVNQGELVKSVLELDDPRLVKRLYLEPADKAYDQAEEQADEINNMLIGFPVQRSKSDDDVAHLQTLVMFVERKMATREIVSPEVGALLMAHGGAHQQALLATQQGKQMLNQMRPQVERAVGWLLGLAESAKRASAIRQQIAGVQQPQAQQPSGLAQPMSQQAQPMVQPQSEGVAA